MKIFLSWSGQKSKAVAEALKDWILQIIQAVDPWISVDIDKGRRWNSEIANQLEESKFGIICLTKDNLESNWIHFEAGALSKTKDAYVWTLLLDIKPADVQPPLGSFQHTTRTKDDIRKLVHTINSALQEDGEKAPPESLINNLFDKLWPELDQQLRAIAEQPSKAASPVRSTEEILQEILEIVRSQERSQALATPEKKPSARILQALENALTSRVKSGLSDAEIIAETQLVVAQFTDLPLSWLEQKIVEIRSDLDFHAFDDPPMIESTTARKTAKSQGRRIHNLEELKELWPAVLARVKRKIGVTAVAYLQDSAPVHMDDKKVILEFVKEFHYEKAKAAAARLPFEQVLNECLAKPHDLTFRLAKEES